MYFINDTPIKNPTTFKKERYNVTTLNRLANAKMTGDIIAQKRKFYFTYEALTGDELDALLELIWNTPTLFFTLSYPENGVQKSAVVYVGSIPADLHRGGGASNWVWKNVSFNFIEQ